MLLSHFGLFFFRYFAFSPMAKKYVLADFTTSDYTTIGYRIIKKKKKDFASASVISSAVNDNGDDE